MVLKIRAKILEKVTPSYHTFPDFWDGGGSEHVRSGSQLEPLDDVERFVYMIRIDSREKLKDLPLE
jgi:hypothetical protein